MKKKKKKKEFERSDILIASNIRSSKSRYYPEGQSSFRLDGDTRTSQPTISNISIL